MTDIISNSEGEALLTEKVNEGIRNIKIKNAAAIAERVSRSLDNSAQSAEVWQELKRMIPARPPLVSKTPVFQFKAPISALVAQGAAIMYDPLDRPETLTVFESPHNR